MNSGIMPNFTRSSGMTSWNWSLGLELALGADRRAEADALGTRPRLDDLLQAGEGAAHDEQHVRRVDLDELLVRVLAAALRRDRGRRALQDLQQGLLDALAGDVAGDRRVFALAGDLVDLVDVDDPGLGLLDVVVGRLDQLQQDVLDVLADVARPPSAPSRRRWRTGRSACGPGSGRAASCRSPWGPAAGCWTSPARWRRRGPARRRSRRPGPACSGCTPRPRGPSWPAPGRRRSPRGTRRSRGAWGVPPTGPRWSPRAPPR